MNSIHYIWECFKKHIWLRKKTDGLRVFSGFSLVELALVLIVTSMIMKTGVELATTQIKRQITQRTAGVLSRIADDVETYMEYNYFVLKGQVDPSSTGTGIRGRLDELSRLINANDISLDAEPVSPDRGNIRLFFIVQNDSIYAVLMSFGGNTSFYTPRPDPNTRFTGKVRTGNKLEGWDFSFDVSAIATLTSETLTGNIAAIRQIAFTTHISPYLHRTPQANSDLNKMDGDLNMGGNSIQNVTRIETESLKAGEIEASNIDIAEKVTAAEVVIDGTLDVRNLNAVTVTTENIIVRSPLQKN